MCFVNVPGLLSIQVAQAAEKTRRVLKNAMAQNSLWATDCRECLPLLHELPELRVRLLGRARVEPESSAVGEHSFLQEQERVLTTADNSGSTRARPSSPTRNSGNS